MFSAPDAVDSVFLVYTTDMGFLRPDIVRLFVINVCNGDL